MREEDDEQEQAGRESLRKFSAPKSARQPPLDFWSEVILRILLVEILWPPLLQLFMSLEKMQWRIFSISGVLELGLSFLRAFLFGILSCGLLFLFLFVSVEMFARIVFKTLQIRSEQLWVATFAGGLAGLSISLVFCLLSHAASMAICCFAIGSATILGQLGGAWGARLWFANPDRFTQFKLSTPPTFRFGIRQLFVMTIWCALVLTALSLLNMFTARLFAVVSIWTVFQVVGLGVAEMLRRRLLRRST